MEDYKREVYFMRNYKSSLILASALFFVWSCTPNRPRPAPKATTGVSQATADVSVGSSGLTVEQENVKRRLEEDNRPGSIKHLYVISAFTGDVILYSTVDGKTSSSGKRLSPYSVVGTDGQYVDRESRGVGIRIGGRSHYTTEVLQDDGTYGSSISYLYWWDTLGRYHQHYVSGGQIIHVSDQPMNFPKIILSLDERAEE